MKNKIFVIMLCFLILNLSLVIAALEDVVEPSMSEGLMAISPASASAPIDEPFTVTIKAQVPANAGAKGAKLKLTYDSSKLSVTSTRVLTDSTWTVGNGFNTNTVGTITFEKSCMFGCNVANGLFNIGSVTFQLASGVLVEGIIGLTLSDNFVGDTKVITGSINHINLVSGAIITIVEGGPSCTGTTTGAIQCGDQGPPAEGDDEDATFVATAGDCDQTTPCQYYCNQNYVLRNGACQSNAEAINTLKGGVGTAVSGQTSWSAALIAQIARLFKIFFGVE